MVQSTTTWADLGTWLATIAGGDGFLAALAGGLTLEMIARPAE